MTLNPHMNVYGHNTYIGGVRLKCTCVAMPEQYDVFIGRTQIGYLRLRHGSFSADYPSVGGVFVYGANPRGDGEFHDNEREYYIKRAIHALLVKHAEKIVEELP